MKWNLCLGAVLAVALAVGFLRHQPVAQAPATRRLADVLPAELPGWSVSDQPVGRTEFWQKVTEETLRFDDHIFRVYQRPGVQFGVYIAYWGHGRHAPQAVAQHTPDRCWTMNGAVCLEARHEVRYAVEQAPLAPAQWRLFRNPDQSQTYVVFWHRVGDRFFDYGRKTAEMLDPVTFWTEAARFMAGGNSEQYFFRISSNLAPEELWLDAGFQRVMQRLAVLGLAEGALKKSGP
jgi:hypothetical protein